MKKTLLSMAEGSSANIDNLNIQGIMRKRLLDLGFTPGAKVKFIFAAPSGNPRAYMIRGTVIALRNSDAENIKIVGV